ncbi:MAG: hypothetical protein AAGJ10_03225 [Bacteroidota bacterium]
MQNAASADGQKGVCKNVHVQKAWVIFSNDTDLKWVRILKRDFRHCFVIWNDGHHWLSFDPLFNHAEINVHYQVQSEQDLLNWLRSQNMKFAQANINHTHKKMAPFGLFTCVEAVKRFLGIHQISIVTPWQLYRHLQKVNSYKKEL